MKSHYWSLEILFFHKVTLCKKTISNGHILTWKVYRHKWKKEGRSWHQSIRYKKTMRDQMNELHRIVDLFDHLRPEIMMIESIYGSSVDLVWQIIQWIDYYFTHQIPNSWDSHGILDRQCYAFCSHDAQCKWSKNSCNGKKIGKLIKNLNKYMHVEPFPHSHFK